MLRNLNEIPVRTFRWLKVNDIDIKETPSLSSMKSFNKNILSMVETSSYSIRMNNLPSNFDNIFKNEDYGVSKEILEENLKEFNCGIILNVKEGHTVSTPIVLDYEMDNLNNKLFDNSIIHLEPNSKATVLLNYKSNDSSIGYHNGQIKIYLSRSSELNLIVNQNLNENTYNIHSMLSIIEEDAKIEVNSIELGGSKSIINYTTNLTGNNSKGFINSVYFGDKNRVLDINLKAAHIGKNTESNIDVKGALSEYSKKTFRGTLDFKKGATKSKGSEEEYIMLLSPSVRNNSIPLLLCGEHEVEGQHAASAGKIDENTLFYLMSRGLSEKEAKKLLVEAYFVPVIDSLPVDALKKSILDTIKERLENV